MPPALASHHARIARDDRSPELLVVGHVVILELPAAAVESPAHVITRSSR
jgi:hypothetical protein